MHLFAAALLLAAVPQDHAACHAVSHERREAVDRRHDDTTGVPHEGSVHHFRVAPDGGEIRLEATDAGDTGTRDRIRVHLREVADAFAAGDFSMPHRIHAEDPPGVGAMRERRGHIRYTFSPTPAGGRVTIVTGDAEALRAVHAFLRYQIADHGTGDPVE